LKLTYLYGYKTVLFVILFVSCCRVLFCGTLCPWKPGWH